MDKKETKLVGNLKKFSYVILLSLSAIFVVNVSEIYSHIPFVSQANTPQIFRETQTNLDLTKFSLGWIDRIERPQTPATVANEGINILIPYTHSHDRQTIETYLNAAQKNNIKVFLEPYRKDIKGEDVGALTEFVRTYKQHPAVAGWYAYDEPVLNKVSPQTLEIAYQTIKAEDPRHPIALVFAPAQGKNVSSYSNAMDIYMINRYPFFFGKPEFDNLGDFGKWMQESAEYAEGKPFWPVLQGYGEQEDGRPKYRRRLPTAAEEKYMFYTAILAGADSVLFYGHHWTRQSWVNSVLTPLVREFKGYLPIIGSGKASQQPLSNRSNIQAVMYQYPSLQKYLLIAINHSRQKITAEIDPQVSVSDNQVQVSNENRNLQLNQGILKDTFNSYDVHVYVID